MTDNPLPQPSTPVRNISWYLPREYAAKLLFVFQQIEMFHNLAVQEERDGHQTARKNGPRHKNGHLKRMPIEDSPRTIAARMPHRKGIGPDPDVLDHRYESELGRMVLREEIEPEQATAGEIYERLWRGYVATLQGPPWPGRGAGVPPAAAARAPRNAGIACAACASGSTSRPPTCCFTPGVERR